MVEEMMLFLRTSTIILLHTQIAPEWCCLLCELGISRQYGECLCHYLHLGKWLFMVCSI